MLWTKLREKEERERESTLWSSSRVERQTRASLGKERERDSSAAAAAAAALSFFYVHAVSGGGEVWGGERRRESSR